MDNTLTKQPELVMEYLVRQLVGLGRCQHAFASAAPNTQPSALLHVALRFLPESKRCCNHGLVSGSGRQSAASRLRACLGMPLVTALNPACLPWVPLPLPSQWQIIFSRSEWPKLKLVATAVRSAPQHPQQPAAARQMLHTAAAQTAGRLRICTLSFLLTARLLCRGRAGHRGMYAWAFMPTTCACYLYG